MESGSLDTWSYRRSDVLEKLDGSFESDGWPVYFCWHRCPHHPLGLW